MSPALAREIMMTRTATAVSLTVLLLIATLPARAASTANGSFESDVLSADSYCISFAAPLCPTVQHRELRAVG
jgi:hypothetical protein